jgi:hypothetical protein
MDQTSHLRAFWWAAALAGAVMFAVGFLPAFEIRLGASVGGGDAQKTYDYVRSWSFASYGTRLSIGALLVSVAVVGVALLGLTRRRSVAALAAVTVLALALSALTASAGFPYDYDPESSQSCSSWSNCGGRFLNPGIQRLRREAAKRPEAKQKEYLFDPSYTARPLRPWKLLEFVSLGLLCVGGFLLFRAVPLLLWAGPALGPISVLAANAWSSSIVCGDGDGLTTPAIAEGNLTLYPALFGLLSGTAALTVKHRKLGAAILVITVLTGLYALLTLGFKCYE